MIVGQSHDLGSIHFDRYITLSKLYNTEATSQYFETLFRFGALHAIAICWSNFFTAIFYFFSLLGDYLIIVYSIEWVIQSKLIVAQLKLKRDYKMFEASEESDVL